MNGKIKTKFAALFAVALMITVCVVPVVGNDGTDAAPVSSSNGEVFEGYELKLFTEGMDNYDDLVYYGPQAVAGIASSDYAFIKIDTVGSKDVGYLVSKETGLFLRFVDIPNYSVEYIVLPIVQLTYTYAGASINAVDVDVVVKQGTSLDKKFENKGQSSDVVPGTTTVTKKEGVFTFGLYAGQGTDNLGLTKAKAVGNFDVEITATQGITQQVIKQTINAGSATVVSGTITDAGNTIIASVYNKNAFSNGLKVKYTINGAGPYTADVGNDGKYQFNVAPGSVVEITDIAWYNPTEVTTNEPYTFENGTFPYSFGTVTDSTQKSFKTKEYTTSVSIYDANGNILPNYADVSVSGQWYTQMKNSNADDYAIASYSGIVTPLRIVDGKAYLSYIEPTGLATGVTAYLVISASSSNYSFEVDSSYVDANSDEALTDLVDDHAGQTIMSSNAFVKAEEQIITVTVNDKGSNPAIGANAPSIKIFKQKETADKKYEITLLSTISNYVYKVDNVYKYAYDYTAEAGYTYIIVAIGTDKTNSAGEFYTFDTVNVSNGNTPAEKSVSDQIKDETGMAQVKNNAATINAEQTTYKISGTVENAEENNIGSVTYNSSDSAPVVDGEFTFYVEEDTIVVISPITGYTPKDGFALGTIDSAKTVEFTKSVSTIQPTPVKYIVTLDKQEDADKTVIFNYTVNGEPFEFSQTVLSAATLAEVEIPAYVGDEIVVSATVYGDVVYSVSAFENYKAVAVEMKDYYFRSMNSSTDNTVIPGATFELEYELNSKPVVQELTTDDDGFVSLTLPAGTSFQYTKDGRFVNAGSEWIGNYEFGTYSAVYLGDFYKVTPATVTIDYIAAYNVDDIYGVDGVNIAEKYTYKTVVGGTVALKAPSIDGFEFVAWMVDGVVVSESADYTLKVDGSCHVDALYSAVHYEEPAEGLSMNVLVIGIVILILGILAVAYGIISKKQ